MLPKSTKRILKQTHKCNGVYERTYNSERKVGRGVRSAFKQLVTFPHLTVLINDYGKNCVKQANQWHGNLTVGYAMDNALTTGLN